MRSVNLIVQERSSDRIDLYFIFQWTRSVFMRGGAIHDRTERQNWATELLLWYCAMFLWREIDSLQLLTLYLTLTHIFSGGKAKINLHMTSKLTVVMPINCLLRSIQFPSPQNGAITSCNCACFPATSLYVFSWAPPPLPPPPNWTYWLMPGLFGLCFLQSLNKGSAISFCWGHFFSFPSHFDRWCFSPSM